MFKMYSIILLLILFLASCFSWNDKDIKNQDVNSWSYIEKNSTDNINTWRTTNQNDKACIQVITYAKNLKTWVCHEFSSPCSVPENYEKVENCESSLKEKKVNDVKNIIDKKSSVDKTVEKNKNINKNETLNKNEKEIIDDFEKDLDSLFDTIK